MRGGAILLMALAIIAGCGQREEPSQTANRTSVAAPTPKTSAVARHRAPGDEPAPAPVVFTPSVARHHPYSFVSMIADTRFIGIDMLPKVDCHAIDLSDCGNDNAAMVIENPITPGGRVARALGWIVVGEARIGALTAVGISRGYVHLPGTLDQQIDGNVAIFAGDRPIAILHRKDEDGYGIGRLERLESGAVRVAPPRPLKPRGDLVLRGKRLLYRPMAAVDSYCGGRVHIPNIYGKPILRARAMLFAAGWKPDKVEHWGLDVTLARFAQAHIAEGEGCATDSAGQCTFRYSSPAGRLEVETGFDPITVETDTESDWLLSYETIWYEVKCSKRHGGLPGRR
jgi:hypothetical protein